MILLTPHEVITQAIEPAMQIIGPHLDTPQARVLLLAIALQESALCTRCQGGGGPARGFWQFEPGGVAGVHKHHASHEPLRVLCKARDVSFDPKPIWAALEDDDVLAAGVARLLLLTDPKRLPAIGEEAAAWSYYIRCWRPGKPGPTRWPANYLAAVRAVKAEEL